MSVSNTRAFTGESMLFNPACTAGEAIEINLPVQWLVRPGEYTLAEALLMQIGVLHRS